MMKNNHKLFKNILKLPIFKTSRNFIKDYSYKIISTISDTFIKEKYDLVISLGYNCATAGYLKKLCIRKFSSPFDWVTGASAEKRLKLIQNDFKDYVNEQFITRLLGEDATNPEEYKKKNPNALPENIHESYINTLTDIRFHHDFVYNEDFHKNIKNVQEKYTRRINNFMKKTNLAKKILLIYIAKNEENYDYLEKTLLELNSKKDFKYDLLIINSDSSLSKNDEICKYMKNIIFVTINNNPVDYTNDWTILCGNIPKIKELIIKQVYEIHITKNILALKFIKLFINLIPNKKFRHKYRPVVNCYINMSKANCN